MNKRQRMIKYTNRAGRRKHATTIARILKKNWFFRITEPISSCWYLDELGKIRPIDIIENILSPFIDFIKNIAMLVASIVFMIILLVFAMPVRILSTLVAWRILHKKVIRWEKEVQDKKQR